MIFKEHLNMHGNKEEKLKVESYRILNAFE